MALESVKNPEGEELIKKWQAEYFDEKAKEMEEKRAKKNSDRKTKTKIVEEQGKKDEEVRFFKININSISNKSSLKFEELHPI